MNQLYNSENKIAAELNTSLVKNIEVLEEMFRDCDDVVKRSFCSGGRMGRFPDI